MSEYTNIPKDPAMLLSRGISYYALLLISAAMTGVAHLTIKQKE